MSSSSRTTCGVAGCEQRCPADFRVIMSNSPFNASPFLVLFLLPAALGTLVRVTSRRRLDRLEDIVSFSLEWGP